MQTLLPQARPPWARSSWRPRPAAAGRVRGGRAGGRQHGFPGNRYRHRAGVSVCQCNIWYVLLFQCVNVSLHCVSHCVCMFLFQPATVSLCHLTVCVPLHCVSHFVCTSLCQPATVSVRYYVGQPHCHCVTSLCQ